MNGQGVIPKTRIRLSLLLVIALSGCRPPDVRLDAVDVRLVAQDTTWSATYLVRESTGATIEVPTGREVHVPLGADVRLALTSRDYISDFTLPAFGLRDFAAPDLPSEFRFNATSEGTYDVRGDELCGRPHTDKTRGLLIVEGADAFSAWLRARMAGSAK